MRNEDLIQYLTDNTTLEIDYQSEYNQVAVWLKSFNKEWSLCFQNGDMNGEYKGTGICTNDGANEGLEEILDILKDRPEFQRLVEPNEYWKYELLKDFIDDFCKYISESNHIDRYFENKLF